MNKQQKRLNKYELSATDGIRKMKQSEQINLEEHTRHMMREGGNCGDDGERDRKDENVNKHRDENCCGKCEKLPLTHRLRQSRKAKECHSHHLMVEKCRECALKKKARRGHGMA